MTEIEALLNIGHGRSLWVAVADPLIALSYIWIASILIWLMFKAKVLRNTPITYLFAGFILFCGIGHLAHVFDFGETFEVIIAQATWMVSFAAAVLIFRTRHTILRLVRSFERLLALSERYDDDAD